MTKGEKASIALLAILLALLLVGGWLASIWRRETQEALRQIAEAQESGPVKSGEMEWTVTLPGREPVKITLDLYVGETEAAWTVRLEDALRRAEVIR